MSSNEACSNQDHSGISPVTQDLQVTVETAVGAADAQPTAVSAKGPCVVMAASEVKLGERRLRVASALDPVFEMKKMAMIGHRLEAHILDTISNAPLDKKALIDLDWGLREAIDLTNIEQGLSLLRKRDEAQRKMMMVIPANFATFSSPTARNKIIASVAKASSDMRIKVIFEIRALTGVPIPRLMEVITLLKPFCMTVVGQVSADRRAISMLCKIGLSGLSIDYDGAKRSDEALHDYLDGFTAAAKMSAGACLMQGFESYQQMAVARQAGVTHASIKAKALLQATKSA